MRKNQKEAREDILINSTFCMVAWWRERREQFPLLSFTCRLGVPQTCLIRPLGRPISCKIFSWKPWGPLEGEAVKNPPQFGPFVTFPRGVWSYHQKVFQELIYRLSPDSWSKGFAGGHLEPPEGLWSLTWVGRGDVAKGIDGLLIPSCNEIRAIYFICFMVGAYK